MDSDKKLLGQKTSVDVGSKNLGLCILRMWMCFEVIIVHFYSEDSIAVYERPFLIFRSMAVLVFIVMSFALSEKMFFDRNFQKLKKRMVRLIIPQVAWALIYYFVLVVTDKIFGVGGQLSQS